jgi:hypothetical protein
MGWEMKVCCARDAVHDRALFSPLTVYQFSWWIEETAGHFE